MRLLLLTVLLTLLGAGCAHVNPWERETLARMARVNVSAAPTRHYDAHFWNVRGAMAGGTGEPGGGCGCN